MLNKDIRLSSFLRLLILSILIGIVLVVSGCATSQKVNREALEASKTKQFKLGIVKAGGSLQSVPSYWTTYISAKEEALGRIPIEEICTTLKEEYALEIDTNIDKTPRVVKESSDNGNTPLPPSTGTGLSLTMTIHIPTENAYYGNLEYDNASILWLMLGRKTETMNDQDVPDVVNVTYELEVVPFTFKARFLYAINVKSSGKDVLILKGVVGTVSALRKDSKSGAEAIWNDYVQYAANINDALKRDLVGASK